MLTLIRNLLIKNWELKLISFLIAFILWISLIPEERTFVEKTISVPLEVHNVPAHLELVEKPPATVDVKIRAPQSLMPQINPATVHVVLDLQMADVRQTEYPLTPNMISLPPGAEVKDIHPSQVSLRLEEGQEVMMEVKPNLIGSLPEGYILEKVEVTPPQILIRGPASRFKKKDVVMTTPVVLSELTQTTEVEVAPIPPNPDLRVASPLSSIKIKIHIKKQADQKENKGEQKKSDRSVKK
jgi:YbbR domain-containing protein